MVPDIWAQHRRVVMEAMKETYSEEKGKDYHPAPGLCFKKKENDYFISSNRIVDFFPKVITVEKNLKL